MSDARDEFCGDDCFQHDLGPTLGRREFGAMALGTGIALAAGTVRAAVPVKENDVTIKTSDGNCDAVFTHPTNGAAPAVVIWTDILGLRPAFRDMARRLAGEGYAVLCPNPYYRTSKAPTFAPDFDFQAPGGREQAMSHAGKIQAPGAAERDAVAFVAWLDSQAAVKKTSKIGTTGYCMGGPLVMRTAAAVPDRIGGVGSFHGGGLVTDKPDSPHLLIPKMKARYLIAVADNDDKAQPGAKDILKTSFAAAKLPAEIEVYAEAMHGWCVPGSRVYHEAQAEKAWARLLATFKTALA